MEARRVEQALYRSGCAHKATPELRQALFEAVRDDEPTAGGRWLGIKAKQWFAAHGVELGLSTTYRAMHLAGLSVQERRLRHAKADAEAQEAFKKRPCRRRRSDSCRAPGGHGRGVADGRSPLRSDPDRAPDLGARSGKRPIAQKQRKNKQLLQPKRGADKPLDRDGCVVHDTDCAARPAGVSVSNLPDYKCRVAGKVLSIRSKREHPPPHAHVKAHPDKHGGWLVVNLKDLSLLKQHGGKHRGKAIFYNKEALKAWPDVKKAMVPILEKLLTEWEKRTPDRRGAG